AVIESIHSVSASPGHALPHSRLFLPRARVRLRAIIDRGCEKGFRAFKGRARYLDAAGMRCTGAAASQPALLFNLR
ncbi:MAG: hypothetical protein JSV65_18935, partial [Armatimonadota bacterium]